ncbi:flagellar basal-body MS-ring/collar protein FliF [Burkholderia sp. SRS-W-2-2016]|uniref:flagellar basal-body MS-ring/collar protein FliF n=1 Tax=Burkholderia sp. SRS-W-2-2016 TaxID=1926878 RepID=UPI000A6F0A81|nr:flagellar basal-body MS-ring/collar protein FliF [Burkholderia sp. SRS-W-2-2016]
MSRFTSFFTDASRERQFIVAGALSALLFGAMAAAFFITRPSYQVLFRDLKPQDASAVVAELDKQKVPYRIDGKTSAILVPENDTRALRLKLMSSDLRLQGAVGFELFNNSDLGLTEFAQKVNYQRALQGELARTIMTLDEIDLARVHLTLPESSLFRRDSARPKASVALFMRDAQALAPETVRGIQRLVAAAVPDLSANDVTVLDQRGDLAGTKGSETAETDDPHFALKQAIEQRYERKILAQIAPIIGAGHVSASVDATLDFAQTRTTRESGVSRPIAGPESAAGTASPLPSSKGSHALPPAGLPPLPSQPSTEGTKTDRSLEQIVSQPGSIRRLSVGIVLDHALPQDDMARINAMVGASIGLDAARGDVLSIYVRHSGGAAASTADATPANAGLAAPVPADPTVDATTGAIHAPTPAASRSAGPATLEDQIARAQRAIRHIAQWSSGNPLIASLGTLLLLVAAGGLIAVRMRRASRRLPSRVLSLRQREAYVARLRALLAKEGEPHGRA